MYTFEIDIEIISDISLLLVYVFHKIKASILGHSLVIEPNVLICPDCIKVKNSKWLYNVPITGIPSLANCRSTKFVPLNLQISSDFKNYFTLPRILNLSLQKYYTVLNKYYHTLMFWIFSEWKFKSFFYYNNILKQERYFNGRFPQGKESSARILITPSASGFWLKLNFVVCRKLQTIILNCVGMQHKYIC